MVSKLLASVILRSLYNVLQRRFTFQRPSIIVIYIRAAFDSPNGSALWHFLVRNGAPAKYVSVLKHLYRLMVSFCHSSLIPVKYAGLPRSLFLFTFDIERMFYRTPRMASLMVELNSSQGTDLLT